jgi:hypothetical protein
MADLPPPFGSSWRALYAVVIVALVLETIVFYAFTRVFA